MTNIKCTINYADGRGPVEMDSIRAAVRELAREWPGLVVIDPAGGRRRRRDADEEYEISYSPWGETGRAAMCWACLADSVDDPGVRAIATIDVAGGAA